MRCERWVQHNLIRDEGRLPALRELTQSAPVEKTAALSTELRGATAKGSAPRPEKMGLKSCSPSAIVVK